jgi:hypothetical protein
MAPAAAKPAEENLAENKESQSLPEVDGVPSENRRHQPVPQSHYKKAKKRETGNHHHHNSQNSRGPVFHRQSLFNP